MVRERSVLLRESMRIREQMRIVSRTCKRAEHGREGGLGALMRWKWESSDVKASQGQGALHAAIMRARSGESG